MKRLLTLFTVSFLIIIFILYPLQSVAQETGQTYRIETTDGNVFIGTLVSEDENRVVLRTQALGEVTIERTNIRRMSQIDPSQVRDGEYWFENPQSTRYLFAPNAITLRKGEGYYQNAWIFFNNVNFGVTDNFSVGAGTVPIFLLGASALPVWILPKFSIPTGKDNFNISLGALLGGVIGEDSSGGGLIYGVTTLGDTNRNLTFGIGYGLRGDVDSPLINISGMTRTGKSFYLLTENYFLPGEEFGGVISGGIRWAPENFAVDFGLIRPLDVSGFIGIPWLGVTIPFGRG